MRKTRIFALLCALVLVLGSLSFASAESKAVMHVNGAENTSKRINSGTPDYYLLKNGKSVTFYIDPNNVYGLLPKKWDQEHFYYSDIQFDCDGRVKAKCSASWVHITNSANEFVMTIDGNNSLKNRTATITVTGKGYKAKFKLIQYGSCKLTSVVRNKKTVTVKFKLASSALKKSGFIAVRWTKSSYDPESGFSTDTYKNEEIEAKPGKAVKFKVKEGFSYSVNVGCGYKINSNHTYRATSDGVWFEVTDENVSEEVKIR